MAVTAWEIRSEDLSGELARNLVRLHLEGTHAHSPPGNVFPGRDKGRRRGRQPLIDGQIKCIGESTRLLFSTFRADDGGLVSVNWSGSSNKKRGRGRTTRIRDRHRLAVL
jgi:hypothetical protein